MAMDKNRVFLDVRRNLYATYPILEQRIVEFITFTRQQRLLVSSKLLTTRALTIASELDIEGFHASNGWLEKFIRKSPVQPSFKLHGKGGSVLPSSHVERMEQIRDIAKHYHVSNIYNMDESGLFYRMGPQRIYLSGFEQRDAVRGTEFGKHKKRVTIVLACDADGTHVLPVSYIGSDNNPRCFRNGRLNSQKNRYWSQKNSWMDSKGFDHWIKWWYSEVQSRSIGPWLLIIDNCGGRELEVSLPGVRIELLPPRTTAKYQPLDLGLVGHSKIRYRSVLLRIVIEVMLQKNLDQSLVQPSSGRGVLGVQEGFLPHVGDAMEIFDETRSQTSRITIMKCWIESICLANEQALTLAREIQRLSVELENLSWLENDEQEAVRQIDPNGITLDDPISEAESRHISASVTSASLLEMPQTP